MKLRFYNHKILTQIFSTVLILMISQTSYAAIVANSVQVGGASNKISTNDTQWKLYGSFVGPDNSGGSIEPTDNCVVEPVGGAFVGCNRNRVSGSTTLNITFSDDVQFTGTRQVLFYKKTGLTVGVGGNNINSNNTPYTQNGSYFSKVTWSLICSEAGGVMADYPAATAAFGSSVVSCMRQDNNTIPLNESVQFAVGIDGGGGIASTEILLNIQFATPLPGIGSFNPGTPALLEGSDGFFGRAGCEGDITPISTPPNTPVDSGAVRGIYDGFCDFNLKPGDEKIRFNSNPGAANTLGYYDNAITTGSTTVPISGFTLFLSNIDFISTQPWSPDVSSVNNKLNTVGSIESGFESSTISSSKIKNGQAVFARMATLDEAGNITHLFDNAMIQAACNLPGALPAALEGMNIDSVAGASHPTYGEYRFYVGQIAPPGSDVLDPPPYSGRCPYATVPSLVTGILKEDINCFVATALKGSPYDYQVLALREFRNRFLKSFSLGRSFIDFYYSEGPKAAQWLNDNPKFKPFFRVLLWPAYLVAFFFNTFGGILGLVLIMSLITTPLILWNLRRKTFFQS